MGLNIKTSEIGKWMAPIIAALIVLGTSNRIFALLALVLGALAIVFSDLEASLAVLMFLLPFSNIFKMSPGSQSFFTYLLLFYVFFALCIIKRKIDKGFLITTFIFVVILLVQSYNSFNVLRTIKFIANIFLIYVSMSFDLKKHHKNIFMFYIFGVVVSSFVANLGLISNLTDYIATKDLGLKNDWLIRFSGLYGDPNYYAVNVIAAMCLVIILLHKKEISVILAYPLIGVFAYFSIITYSKSALLMLAFPAMFFVYSTLRRKKYFWTIAFVVLLVVFGQKVLSGQIDILDVILKRFSEGNGDVTTGRSGSWEVYLTFFRDNTAKFAIGSGLGAEILGGKAPHNTYIDFLYYTGVLGTLLFVLTLFAMPKSSMPNEKRNVMNFSVAICIAVMYFFLSEIFYIDLPFHLILAMYAYYLPLNERR